MSDRMSELMSDSRLDFLSDRISESICLIECPDRISENVMVGIS